MGASPTYDLVERTFNEYKNEIVASFSLYSTVLTTGSSVTLNLGQEVVLKVIGQTNEALANQIKASEFDGVVRLEREGGEVVTFTKVNGFYKYIVHFQLEGIGIYREN